jgi:hypothetical protein
MICPLAQSGIQIQEMEEQDIQDEQDESRQLVSCTNEGMEYAQESSETNQLDSYGQTRPLIGQQAHPTVTGQQTPPTVIEQLFIISQQQQQFQQAGGAISNVDPAVEMSSVYPIQPELVVFPGNQAIPQDNMHQYMNSMQINQCTEPVIDPPTADTTPAPPMAQALPATQTPPTAQAPPMAQAPSSCGACHQAAESNFTTNFSLPNIPMNSDQVLLPSEEKSRFSVFMRSKPKQKKTKKVKEKPTAVQTTVSENKKFQFF